MIINEILLEEPQVGDVIDLELGDTLIETVITDVTDDGIVIDLDATALNILVQESKKYIAESETRRVKQSEVEQKLHDLHAQYREAVKSGDHKEADRLGQEIEAYSRERRAIVPDDWGLEEAKYQGREVPLGKPMAGDVKKSKVYVKGPKGNVVKVNFGDKKMKIKKSNPKRRKSFRARHNCDNPGPRWKARYWSCRAW